MLLPTPTYHPQVNPTERVTRVLKTLLYIYIEENRIESKRKTVKIIILTLNFQYSVEKCCDLRQAITRRDGLCTQNYAICKILKRPSVEQL